MAQSETLGAASLSKSEDATSKSGNVRQDMDLYGVSITLIKLVTGCGASTAKRWKAGGSIPEPTKRLLKLMLEGDLGQVSKAWRGWKLRNDALVSPNGDSFHAGEVQAIPFRMMQLSSYQAEQRLPRQADFIEERWEPAKDLTLASD